MELFNGTMAYAGLPAIQMVNLNMSMSRRARARAGTAKEPPARTVIKNSSNGRNRPKVPVPCYAEFLGSGRTRSVSTNPTVNKPASTRKGMS